MGLKRLLPKRAVLGWPWTRSSGSSDDSPVDGGAGLVFGHIHRPLIEKGKSLTRMSAPILVLPEVEAKEVQGSIIPLALPSCNYLRVAGSLARSNY